MMNNEVIKLMFFGFEYEIGIGCYIGRYRFD